MKMIYHKKNKILDKMAETSSTWKSRYNMPQGDPSIIPLIMEMQYQGKKIMKLTTIITLLLKNQIPRQVKAMDDAQGSDYNSMVIGKQY